MPIKYNIIVNFLIIKFHIHKTFRTVKTCGLDFLTLPEFLIK